MRAALLALALCTLATDAPGRAESSVRFFALPDGRRCSGVVVAPTLAYTAAHCLPAPAPLCGAGELGGVTVTGAPVAADLAELRPAVGRFPPPYAVRSPPVTAALVVVEGYGCDPQRLAVGYQARRSTRLGILVAQDGAPGLELVLWARVCGGDSGGAVWHSGRGLVGILTERSLTSRSVGYATPLPTKSPAQ